MNYSRRDLGKLALAAGTVSRVFAAAKPNSKFGGVQVGANVPYIFRGMPGGADDILKYCVDPTISISALELRSRPVEDFLGAPAPAGRGGFGGRAGAGGAARSGAGGAGPAGQGAGPMSGGAGGAARSGAGPAGQGAGPMPGGAGGREGGAPGADAIPGGGAARAGRGAPTPEQAAERKAAAEALAKWRTSRSMSEFKAFRKKYEDAGMLIQIVKFDGIDSFTDDELDYSFQMAKELGAQYLSCEIPVSKTKRLGAFAEKHKMMVGYHGHGNLTDPEAFGRLGAWEQAFWYSKYNGANVDVGHFFASNGFSPAQWIKENHTRITHLHLKDRKANNGPNVPWGEGDTPLKEVLQLMKKEKYSFQATIEMEHPIPQGSNALAELSKCVAYCRNVLS